MTVVTFKLPRLDFIHVLAETPGVARDYIRNEGTLKINLVLYKNNYNLHRFKPPRERAPVLNESEAGWAQKPVWLPSNGPRRDPKEKMDGNFEELS
jgi:hypothetical protein